MVSERAKCPKCGGDLDAVVTETYSVGLYKDSLEFLWDTFDGDYIESKIIEATCYDCATTWSDEHEFFNLYLEVVEGKELV